MHRLILALARLGLMAAIPAGLFAQSAEDTTATSLSRLVTGLSPSARLRLSYGGERWSGRLEARHADSLTIAGTAVTRTIPLAAIDTLWLHRESHTALAAGAGFGALMFALFQLSDDRYYGTRLGAIIFLGSATAGLLIDGMS
ncbi:MAG TPA: hypothetical protein VD930_02160, partial [Gemmatimonadales bacterium]|nr:hypothetical protein [Gemmatimonadales bacterium]